MDDEVVIIGDDGTEHVFPAGFDPQKAAAIVRGGAPAGSGSGPPLTPMVAAGITAGKAVPAVVSGVNKGAKAISAVDPVVASIVGSAVPHGGAAMGAAAPKVAGVIAKATNPATVATRGVGGRFATGSRAAGPVMRGANALSRLFDKASLPAMLLSSLYDTYQGGQAQAAKLDDPSLAQAERDELLRQLHSYGGF